jgi:hypothetical protein
MHGLRTTTPRNGSPTWRMDAVDVLVTIAVLVMMASIALL